jgi:subtilase family serine protease
LLEHLKLVVARSPKREQAFQQFLRDQYNPKSPSYHKWLTPQQVGEEFGADSEVLDKVSMWLTSHGLKVNSISINRVIIDFSGTIGSVSSALSANFRYFNHNGDVLISLTTEPHISTGLSPKIKFIAGLSSVRTSPAGAPVDTKPDLNCATGCVHVVSPADFAAIYGLSSVYGAGVAGSGQTIAAVGFSRVTDSDIELFQQSAGLLVADPIQRVAPDGTDPGPPNPGATDTEFLKEATLDVERAFGVAPNAAVILDVTAPPSDAVITNLLNIPIADVIDNDLAPILSISFHGCEADAGLPQVLFADALFQQAAAEGISVFVSAGDSGVADCAAHGVLPPATASQTINYLCASSYVTCVGGTEFNDATDPSKYWAPTNSGYLLSALGYIPEGAWNESSVTILLAGGGGTSQWIPQPPWQVGTGVPVNGKRNVPDVAFTASMHDGYYGCLAEPNGDGDCSQHKFLSFYGTSASAPSMAGIMALVDQTLGGRQGNFNATLYSLAATPSNQVFNDVTVASSGVSSCSTGMPSLCNNSVTFSAGSTPAVLPGFLVNSGYDLVTGWGSINVANLLSSLTSQPSGAPSTTSLLLSAPSISTAQGTTMTVQVFGNAGTPTGTVQITSNGVPYTPPIGLDFGLVELSNLSFPTAGTYNIVAQYSGDSKYAPGSSAVVVLTSVPPSFQLSASSSSVVISSPGGSATSTIIASTTDGYVGALQLTCAVAASDGVQMRDSPACSLSAGGQALLTSNSSAATLTLTIGTVASGATVGNTASSLRRSSIIGETVFTVGSMSILLLLLFSNRRSYQTSHCMLVVLLLTIFFVCAGCPSHRSGTPLGSYIVTLTAKSASSTVSTHINVTVN